MTILSFVAMFAGLGLGMNTGEFGSAGTLIAGVFLGSATWWLGLSAGVGLVRTRMTPAWMRIVNAASGLMILAGGVRARRAV